MADGAHINGRSRLWKAFTERQFFVGKKFFSLICPFYDQIEDLRICLSNVWSSKFGVLQPFHFAYVNGFFFSLETQDEVQTSSQFSRSASSEVAFFHEKSLMKTETFPKVLSFGSLTMF